MDLTEQQAFKTLAYLYAQAMDRNRPELLDGIFTDDVLVEGPGFSIPGKEANKNSPRLLSEMYTLTQHVVHNQTVTVTGDEASGETYCTANHVTRTGEGVGTVLAWGLRYLDRYRKVGGEWRFSGRKLVIDWTETRPVELPAG